MKVHSGGYLCLLAGGLVTCLWGWPLRAAEQTTTEGDAVVLEVRGQVDFRPLAADDWQPLRVSQVLQAGDAVRTGKHSRVTLKLGDKIEVRLNSNSTFEVQVPESGRQSRSLALLVGSLLARVTAGPEGTPFQVFGGNAVAGVRGTEFAVAVADDGAFLATVTRGRVEVEGQDSLVLEAGQAATVDDDDGQVVPSPGPLQVSTWLAERSRRLAGRVLQRARHWREGLRRHLAQLQESVRNLEREQRQLARLGNQAARARRAGRAELVEKLSGEMARRVARLRRARHRLRRRAVWLQSRLVLLGRLSRQTGIDEAARRQLQQLEAATRQTRRRWRRLRRRAVAGLRRLVRREARMIRTWQLLRHGLDKAGQRVLKNQLRRRAH